MGMALVLAVPAGLLLARGWFVSRLLSLHAPHRVHRATGTLLPPLAAQLDAEVKARPPRSAEELIQLGLAATSRHFHFGLNHRTRLSFDGVEREGHCVEYAELFASILEHVRGPQEVRAWVVRSDASVAGVRFSNPAWKDHDWVLVRVGARTDEKRFYVDPSFEDVGLGWDISGAVHGEVHVP